jgi:hypothetical protein
MTGLNYTAALNGNVSLDGFRDCQRGLLIRVGHPCPVGAVKIKSGQLQVERVDSGKGLGRLSEIEYSLNEPKCFDGDGEPERITQWPGVTDYPYLLRKNQGCISKEGNFIESELIDVSSERAVYEGNKVYDYFKRALPLYDTFINYPKNKMNLYAYYTPGFDFVLSHLTIDSMQRLSAANSLLHIAILPKKLAFLGPLHSRLCNNAHCRHSNSSPVKTPGRTLDQEFSQPVRRGNIAPSFLGSYYLESRKYRLVQT